MKKLIINNRFFNSIIKKYFEKNKYLLNKYNIICDIDSLYYYNNYKNSSIINQIEDYNILGDKYTHYKLLLDKKGSLYNFMLYTVLFNKNNYKNKLKGIINKYKLWIIKPRNSYGRDGVNIVTNLEDIYNKIENKKTKEWIIQKYIDNPLLLNDKKFHIRVYPVIYITKNKFNRDTFNILLYREGFIYTSGGKYNKYDINLKTHLSGEDNINRVIVFDKNNKLYNKLWNKIVYLVKNSIYPIKEYIKCPNSKSCYKLLGYDILIDENYNLYLAEINARLISLKYPPKYFKEKMYISILEAVFKNKYKNIDLIYTDKIINYKLIIVLIIIFILIILILLYYYKFLYIIQKK